MLHFSQIIAGHNRTQHRGHRLEGEIDKVQIFDRVFIETHQISKWKEFMCIINISEKGKPRKHWQI